MSTAELTETTTATQPTAVPNSAPANGIRVTGLRRIFADGSGLHATSFEIGAGEFVSVLGPSGCGKSTLLRCLAGLEAPDAGRIDFGTTPVFDDTTRTNMPPRQRGIGMVFQDLALWPHLSAFENVAFPLRVNGTPRGVITSEVDRVLALVGLEHFARKLPHQLSGGQQQRVAIARAIVASPRILLMDEPFSALDAALHVQLRRELRELTTELGLTTIYVTHDQTDAMAMSDRIAVLEAGRLRQLGTPEQLYLTPANEFVASFIGRFNRMPAGAHPAGESGVRPEQVRLLEADSTPGREEIVVDAVVTSTVFVGGGYALNCRIASVDEPWELTARIRPETGEAVRLAVSLADVISVAAPVAPDTGAH